MKMNKKLAQLEQQSQNLSKEIVQLKTQLEQQFHGQTYALHEPVIKQHESLLKPIEKKLTENAELYNERLDLQDLKVSESYF